MSKPRVELWGVVAVHGPPTHPDRVTVGHPQTTESPFTDAAPGTVTLWMVEQRISKGRSRYVTWDPLTIQIR